MTETYYKVAVDAPLSGALTYLPPEECPDPPRRGQSVTVPLGKRKVNGVVLATDSMASAEFKLKPIHAVVDSRPLISDHFLRWMEWLAEYYMHPVGQVAALAFPPLEARDRKRKSKKSAVVPAQAADRPKELTEEQQRVLTNIESSPGFAAHLLHGVTGSGKTEVYLRLLAGTLAKGQRGLVLVPEISLTPQLIQRFAARFGDQIAVLHSHLTEREKTDQWWAAVRGEARILIGARSALFCPIEDLGLIVIDEEHEPSFKQDEKLKYHARDAAIMLAKLSGCPIVLGSATPSLESWKNAQDGRYHLHQMFARVADRPMPEITVVDLRETRRHRHDLSHLTAIADLPFWMSPELYTELVRTFERGDQAALFLNRRGIAQLALCGACGHKYECPNCAIALTLHGRNHLVCHYCDFTQKLDEHCPSCSSDDVKPLGLGTELIEADMARLFPRARLARADRDEIQSREALEELIRSVEAREVDVLIGTQMIAKGLDFPGLNLVGLVMADVGFNMPDFRASERSFQLLTQVSGRSGRHSLDPGKVIIQTYNPTHAAIVFTCKNDFAGFCAAELESRRELLYPPYSRLALVKLQGPSHETALSGASLLKRRSEALLKLRSEYSRLMFLGPAPAPIAKLRGKFRFQALLKSVGAKELNAFCRQLVGDGAWLPSGVRLQIDIDPLNML